MLLNCGVEKALENPLDCKEIQPVNPKGNQSWIFIGRTDAEADKHFGHLMQRPDSFFFKFFKFYFYFILLYNTVLVLPYIDMNPPWVYTSSQSWIPLPPPTPYHLSGSSPCTSPKHPVSCIEHRLEICILPDSIHFQCHSPKSSHPLPLPQSPKDCSIHLCLFCYLTYRVIVTIFLNSIYMC